jgi:hypothetical protein
MLINLQCNVCGTNLRRHQSYIDNCLEKGTTKTYCSRKCYKISKNTKITINCKECYKQFNRRKNSKQLFCSRSCSRSYINKHKSTGTRVSKLEKWLQNKLKELYPQLKFSYNAKEIINSELDIYLPDLKLGFEINGIYHYEPVHGEQLLKRIQLNDNNKFKACQQAGISLCVINTSDQVYFKEYTSQRYLSIIKDIIDKHLKTGAEGNRTPVF